MSVLGKMRVFSFKMFVTDSEKWRRLSMSPFSETGLGSVIRTMLEFAAKVARPAPLDPDRLVIDEVGLEKMARYYDRIYRGPGKESAESNGITVAAEPVAADVGAELPNQASTVAKAKKAPRKAPPKVKSVKGSPGRNGKAKAAPKAGKKKAMMLTEGCMPMKSR